MLCLLLLCLLLFLLLRRLRCLWRWFWCFCWRGWLRLWHWRGCGHGGLAFGLHLWRLLLLWGLLRRLRRGLLTARGLCRGWGLLRGAGGAAGGGGVEHLLLARLLLEVLLVLEVLELLLRREGQRRARVAREGGVRSIARRQCGARGGHEALGRRTLSLQEHLLLLLLVLLVLVEALEVLRVRVEPLQVLVLCTPEG